MRITLEHPATQPRQVIGLPEIISIEGQQYKVRLNVGNEQRLLSDNKGVTCLFRSAWQVQEQKA